MTDLGAELRASLVFPDPATALSSEEYIESSHPALIEAAASLCGGADERERAVGAFVLVRDAVRYEFMAKLRPEEYRASYVLERRRGFCVQKAVLLAAMLRACNIPSVLVLANLRDHTMPDRVARAMGTNVMHGHGLVAAWLSGKWLLVDASHDQSFAERKGYRLVGWDGREDALIAATTRDGRRHAEYGALRGPYLDLPYAGLMRDFGRAYAGADVQALIDAGVPVGDLGRTELEELARRQ